MSEYTNVLERIGDRATMPEPALDRLVGRRERRRRNRRISASIVGVTIAVVIAVALGSARLDVSPRPGTTPATNGSIAYTLADRGIYLATEGAQPRLSVGRPGDGVVEWCPTFSPDGTRLAFTRVGTAGRTIFVFVTDVADTGVVDATTRRVASFDGEYWACPEWSPDSTRLLYTGFEGAWVVGLEQGASPVLLSDAEGLDDAAWSPGGSQVALLSRDGALSIVSARDGSLVRTMSGLHDATLSWSPSGDRIAVGHGDTGFRSPVALLDVENGERADLMAAGRAFAGYGDPSWSPDATSIALLDHDGVDEGIIIVRPDDDTWHRIPLPPSDVPDVWALAWSPDSQRLLVALGCSVYSISADGSDEPVLVSSPDVDPQRCLTPPGIDWQPVSP
jgi:WD40 repeat protein